MEIFGQTPAQVILFFVLYGVTGAVPFIAALYLLLRRGNAFAPDITPPLRLRRWAASLFAAVTLSHVWWLLLYIFSRDINPMAYVLVVMLDCVTLLTTIAGTLLSMLQDRRRPVWPVLVAMIPFVALWGVLMVYPDDRFKQIASAYVLFLFVLFTVYMVFAVRRYGRWLNDNYADLENKKVWLSQTVTLGCLLLFILYAIADISFTLLIFLMHLTEFVLFGLLLWRVDTLSSLTPKSLTANGDAFGKGLDVEAVNIDLAQIERLLAEHCVATQLYLQHDLTSQQLAHAIGTNRFYLSQYFSRQGITYNTYINNLRINHFISRYQEAAAAGRPIIAQQLASDSGYRSYSTFSLAFKQRTGQSVTAWMHDTTQL